MKRWLFLGIWVVLNCINLVAKNDTIRQNQDYKKMLAQLFVVSYDNIDLNAECQPGYILGEANGFDKLTRDDVKFIVDLRYGMKDQLPFPYPDAELTSRITDAILMDSLKYSALLLECKRGADGIGIMDNGNQIISVIADELLNARQYQVVDFPDDIMSTLPYRNLKTQKIRADLVSLWNINQLGEVNFLNWNGESSLQRSFEELLDYGVLFYTRNFNEDYNKLIRAYEHNLMLIDSKMKQYVLLDTAGINDTLEGMNKIQLEMNQASWRKEVFRHSIAVYQKRAVVPVVNIDRVGCVVDDYRLKKDDEFYIRANYYHPEIKKYTPEIEDVDLYIALCDDASSLIAMTEELRKRNFQQSTNKVLVAKGLSASFYNSTLLDVFDAVIVADAHDNITWDMLAQAVYGGFSFDGKSDEANHLLLSGFKHSSVEKTRLGFSLPECTGMSNDSLMLIDDLVKSAIVQKATPGAQVLIARFGEVVWQKSYGYHTYSKKTKVQNDDLYDVASVSKLCATLPIIMRMYEKHQVNLDDSLVNYLPGIDTTDKKDITIKELLLHQSGLRSFIPFHTNAIDQESLNGHSLYNGRYSSVYNVKLDDWYYQNKYARYRSDVFNERRDSLFKIRISKNCFMNYHYIDSMKAMAYNSELRKDKDYLYSDVAYHFLHMVMEQKLKLPLDEYFYSNFTNRMGASKVVYNPLNYFDTNAIIPTENDLAFRKELLRGYVHDQGAAMIGGVAANAGIFANAGDLAKLSQMLLNNGSYGGVRYFDANTIDLFTAKQLAENRRGLGVDKPETDPEKQSPASFLASPSSYGHTGFTGTMVWIDPEYQLIYIFLSNRIYPRAYNKKLIEMNVRTNIQDVIYKSVIIH